MTRLRAVLLVALVAPSPGWAETLIRLCGEGRTRDVYVLRSARDGTLALLTASDPIPVTGTREMMSFAAEGEIVQLLPDLRGVAAASGLVETPCIDLDAAAPVLAAAFMDRGGTRDRDASRMRRDLLAAAGTEAALRARLAAALADALAAGTATEDALTEAQRVDALLSQARAELSEVDDAASPRCGPRPCSTNRWRSCAVSSWACRAFSTPPPSPMPTPASRSRRWAAT